MTNAHNFMSDSDLSSHLHRAHGWLGHYGQDVAPSEMLAQHRELHALAALERPRLLTYEEWCAEWDKGNR